MRRLVAAALVLLTAAPLLAQEPPPLLITDKGYYLVSYDAAGEPVLVKLTNVIRIGAPPTPGPDQPPGPAPTDVTQRVRDWATAADHPIGAQALALVYETVGAQVAAGAVPPDQAFKAILEATNRVLGVVGGADKWTEFRAKLGQEINYRISQGGLKTKEEVATLCDQVSKGLSTSAAGSPAISPELLQLIVQLVMAILTQLFGGGLGGDTPGPV